MSLIQQTTMANEATLLSIPREIRDLIYTALFQIPNDPPPSPEEAGPRFRNGSTFYSVDLYPEAVYAALLRCSHQIRGEFQEALFARQPILDCRLDCMIKDDDVWPTWVLLPCPGTKDVGILNFDLRLFDVDDGVDQFDVEGMCFLRPFHSRPRYLMTKSGNNIAEISTAIPPPSVQ